MKPGFLTLDEIRQLFSLLKENDVNEFSLDRGDEKISLKRGFRDSQFEANHHPSSSVASSVVTRSEQLETNGADDSLSRRGSVSEQGAKAAAQRRAGEVQSASLANLKDVRSPMVGTYFSRPAPDSEPFVRVGDYVTKGQVLCIIEAMKVMNEVESDATGRVAEILLADGQVVEFEETIFRIDPGV